MKITQKNFGAKIITKLFSDDEILLIQQYATSVASEKKLIQENDHLSHLKWWSTRFDLEFAKKKIDDYLGLDDSGMKLLYFLAPGVKLPVHRDYSGASASNRIRFHVPIVTNDDVKFIVDGDIIKMSVGELWMLDTSYLHSVENNSDIERIHIVYEVDINQKIRTYIPANFKHRLHIVYFWILSFIKLIKSLTITLALNPKIAFVRLKVVWRFVLWKFGVGHIQKNNKNKSI